MQLELEEFDIIGIAVRTTNHNRQAESDIGALWERFYRDDCKLKISGKISEDLYCVFTDYETDHLGAYTTVLGCQVKPGTIPSAGFIRRIILKSRYQVFISKGTLPECVQQTWMEIWNSDLRRSYTADFDVYGSDSNNPAAASVNTFVGIE
jgi:predicted transcriptional regulator YdeE